MKQNNRSFSETVQQVFYRRTGFSLVELLVVVAIMAVLGVVAYQAFGGQTSKARDSRRIQDMASIEGALQVYLQEKGFVPMPSVKSAKNMWGYDSTVSAKASNTIKVTYNGDAILSVVLNDTFGGGRVLNRDGSKQVGAKGVIDKSILPSSRLSKVPTDPQISNISVASDKKFLDDYGLGKYVYAVYGKAAAVGSWNASNKTATAFQLAATLENDGTPMTYIVGNYDDSLDLGANLPQSLIGKGDTAVNDDNLMDKDKFNGSASTDENQGIPYPINDFAS